MYQVYSSENCEVIGCPNHCLAGFKVCFYHLPKPTTTTNTTADTPYLMIDAAGTTFKK